MVYRVYASRFRDLGLEIRRFSIQESSVWSLKM